MLEPVGKGKEPSYFVKKFYRNPKKDFPNRVINISENNKAVIEKYHKKKYESEKPSEVKVTKTPRHLIHKERQKKH